MQYNKQFAILTYSSHTVKYYLSVAFVLTERSQVLLLYNLGPIFPITALALGWGLKLAFSVITKTGWL